MIVSQTGSPLKVTRGSVAFNTSENPVQPLPRSLIGGNPGSN